MPHDALKIALTAWNPTRVANRRVLFYGFRHFLRSWSACRLSAADAAEYLLRHYTLGCGAGFTCAFLGIMSCCPVNTAIDSAAPGIPNKA